MILDVGMSSSQFSKVSFFLSKTCNPDQVGDTTTVRDAMVDQSISQRLIKFSEA
jgi:hypothetical protein